MSDTEIIGRIFPSLSIRRDESGISWFSIVPVEKRIQFSKLYNGNLALSVRDGQKQIVIELDQDDRSHLEAILRS